MEFFWYGPPKKEGQPFLFSFVEGHWTMLISMHLFSSPEKTASTPKSFTAKPAESSLSSYSFPVTILMTQLEYVHNMYKICLRFPPAVSDKIILKKDHQFFFSTPFHLGNCILLLGGGRVYKFVNPKRS